MFSTLLLKLKLEIEDAKSQLRLKVDILELSTVQGFLDLLCLFDSSCMLIFSRYNIMESWNDQQSVFSELNNWRETFRVKIFDDKGSLTEPPSPRKWKSTCPSGMTINVFQGLSSSSRTFMSLARLRCTGREVNTWNFAGYKTVSFIRVVRLW